MPKKNFTPEQIIQKLREVEVNLSKGMSVQEAVRQIEVTDEQYEVDLLQPSISSRIGRIPTQTNLFSR